MDAIVTRKLTKVYRTLRRPGEPSLAELGLSVREHEIFGFLGRNGAGKTTTIKMLCSLLKPTAGEAFVFGENVRSRAARRLIGYLPEQPYFYEYLTPRETIDFYGQLRGLRAAERARQWDRLSERLDLRGIAGQRIKTFSKGMRQRLGFAVALVNDPPLLILDEPMSGLDPAGRRMIRELILEQRAAGKTVFFSSHVLGDVQQICDRVGILVEGRLTQQGRIDELIDARVKRVEVTASGLEPEAAAAIAAKALEHRPADSTEVFTFADGQTANEAVRAVHARGGAVLEYTPVRETLEDYFMRVQAAGSAVRYEE